MLVLTAKSAKYQHLLWIQLTLGGSKSTFEAAVRKEPKQNKSFLPSALSSHMHTILKFLYILLCNVTDFLRAGLGGIR